MRVYQGIDLVQISRIQKLVEKSSSQALRRLFTAAEIRYCESKKMKFEHYAVRFAAKEAVIKILKPLIKKTLPPSEIEVCREATGKPFIRFGKLIRRQLPAGSRIEISLSHEREIAIAAAVMTLEDAGR